MRFKDALSLVPDDLPDGAYWALAHDIAGLEYGEGFDELIGAEDLSSYYKANRKRKKEKKPPPKFTQELLKMGFHPMKDPYLFRSEILSPFIDYWPTKHKWRYDGANYSGTVDQLRAFIKARQ